MKYFYTDPLKAAWMAREFNIKFQFSVNTINGEEFWDFAEGFNYAGMPLTEAQKFDVKYYIQDPYIIRPQIGDITLDELGDSYKWDLVTTLSKLSGEEIIKRNGKTFFMPEVENA